MFSAFLDTCVLWPSLQRDFLLSLAVEGLYRPLWSEAILEELEFHECQKLIMRHDLPEPDAAQRAARLIERMREAFPDAVVVGWESLEGSCGLPDLNDEHVVAAAHVGGAGAIVTSNVKDFPRAKVPDSIQVLRPVEFLFNTVSVDPVRAAVAVTELADRQARRDSSRDVDWVLGELERRYGLHAVVGLIRSS
ncbi:MAG: PIN domain-containing protein [Actinomycetales bacterium]|nr:PIN domain-containing protein [Actinomycetales bacterium]